MGHQWVTLRADVTRLSTYLEQGKRRKWVTWVMWVMFFIIYVAMSFWVVDPPIALYGSRMRSDVTQATHIDKTPAQKP